MSSCTLVLMRHGKSDWSVNATDQDRPLTARGRRQAAEAGRWIADNATPDLAVVSPATRAARAWELAAAELPEQPPVRVEEDAYTFDGLDLLGVVRSLKKKHRTVVLVGHNPACEELVELLTGEKPEMKTSALAVVQLPDWRSPGQLVAHGRPPTPGD